MNDLNTNLKTGWIEIAVERLRAGVTPEELTAQAKTAGKMSDEQITTLISTAQQRLVDEWRQKVASFGLPEEDEIADVCDRLQRRLPPAALVMYNDKLSCSKKRPLTLHDIAQIAVLHRRNINRQEGQSPTKALLKGTGREAIMEVSAALDILTITKFCAIVSPHCHSKHQCAIWELTDEDFWQHRTLM